MKFFKLFDNVVIVLAIVLTPILLYGHFWIQAGTWFVLGLSSYASKRQTKYYEEIEYKYLMKDYNE